MANPILTAEDREAHPGWAVRFSDGTWLGGAHGWFRAAESFYADRYESKEIAERYLKQVREDELYGNEFADPAEIIEAWQPLCESLRVRIHSLKEAANISPSELSDITFDLENVLHSLQEAQKPKKK